MSNNIFLECSKLKGSAQQEGFKDQVELASMQWSFMQPVNRSGTGLAAGKAIPSGVSILKKLDLSSTKFAQLGASGGHVEEVKLHFLMAGDNQKEYFTIGLKHAMVSSYSVSVSGDGDAMESISLEFKEITYEYKQQGNDGKMGGSGSFSWDTSKMIAKN